MFRDEILERKHQDNDKEIFDYASAVVSGIESGVESLVNTVIHPLDEMVYPMSELLYDSTIILATHGQTLNPLITENPQLYFDSMDRMKARVEALKLLGEKFINASGLQKVEMLSEGATTLLVPGVVLKGAKVMAKSVIPFNPPKYRAVERRSEPVSIETLSPSEVRAQYLHGIASDKIYELNYVVTMDRELLISTQGGYFHWDLTAGKPVLAAGNISIKNGKIAYVNNSSGTYAPQGAHLKKFTEAVFQENGFPEAANKYVDFYEKTRHLRNPVIPHIKDNLIPYSAAAVILLTKLSKTNTHNDHSESTRWTIPQNNSALPLGGLAPFFKIPNIPLEGESLYRGVKEMPGEVFKVGMMPRGTDRNLFSKGDPYGLNSAYLYATTLREEAAKYPAIITPQTKQIAIYEIHSPQKPLNMLEEYRSQMSEADIEMLKEGYEQDFINNFGHERSFLEKIRPRDLKGAWIVDIERTPFTEEQISRMLQANSSVTREAIDRWVNDNAVRTIREPFIPNSEYIPPGLFAQNLLKAAKGFGYVGTAVGLTLDGISLNREYQLSKATGDYTNTYREATRITGAWTGAAAFGAYIGTQAAAFCAPIYPPVGPAACGVLGGLGGAIYGYAMGDEVSTRIFDASVTTKKPVTQSAQPAASVPNAYVAAITPKPSLNRFIARIRGDDAKPKKVDVVSSNTKIVTSSSSNQRRYHSLNPVKSLFTPYSSHSSPSPFMNTMFGSSRFYSSPYSSSFGKSFSDSHLYSNLLFKAMVGTLSNTDKIDLNKLNYSHQQSVLTAFGNHIRSKISLSGYSGFSSLLGSTGLTSSYNSLMGELAIFRSLGGVGDIGGVATRVGELKGFKDSITHALHQEHIFAVKTTSGQKPFSDDELKQILRELAVGIYVHDTFPFFSLHFNEDGRLYPVIHPAYENTLVGEVIGLLDYMMKGFLNGGFYSADFLKNWHTTSSMDKKFLKENIKDLQRYCREYLEGAPYISLREMMAREGLEGPEQDMSDNPNSIYKTKFKTSFRIIAHIPEVCEEDGVFIINPDFDVESTVDLMPDYKAHIEKYQRENGHYPKEYLSLLALYEKMKQNIKEQMPKIPKFQEYFQKLNIICFAAYYMKTMKTNGMMPLFEKAPVVHPVAFPKALPPIPVRHYVFHKIALTMQTFIQHCHHEESTPGFTGISLNQILREMVDQSLPEPSEQAISRVNMAVNTLVIKLLPVDIVSLGIDVEFLRNCRRNVLDALISHSLNYRFTLRKIANDIFALVPSVGSIKLLEQKATFQESIACLKNLIVQFEQAQLASNDPVLSKADFEKFRHMRAEAIDKQTSEQRQKVAQENIDLQQFLQENQAKLARWTQILNNSPTIAVLDPLINIAQQNIAFLNQQLTQVPYKSPITDDELRGYLTNLVLQRPDSAQLDIPKTVEGNLPQARINAAQDNQRVLAQKLAQENRLQQLQGARQEILGIQAEMSRLEGLGQERQAQLTSLPQRDALSISAIIANIDRQILEFKRQALVKMIADWNAVLDRYIGSLEQLSAVLFRQTTSNRNLVPTYQQSVLAVADGGYYHDAGDNFKIVGGCSVRLPNLEIHRLWQSDRSLLLKASVLAPTLKNESFDSELLEHQDGKYAVFKMRVKETDGSLVDTMQLMSSLENVTAPTFEDPEVDMLSHLMLDDFSGITAEFNIQAKDLSGRTMLDRVVESGSPSAVNFMIDKAPSLLSTTSTRGILPLYTAASAGNTEVVNLLLDKAPTQVNSTTQDDETPLMIAATGGHTTTTEALILKGAAVNHRLPNGLTALWKALQNRQEDAALVLIKTPGIALSFVLDNGENVLHEAIKQKLPNAAKALIGGAALLQSRKSDGKTPWHLAADMGQTEILSAMLASGKITDVNITTEALMNAETDLVTRTGTTALHLSASNGHLEIVNLLTTPPTQGQLDLKNKQERTALQLAMEGGYEEVALRLIKCGAGDASDLVCAAELKMFNVADALVEKSIPVSTESNTDEADYGYYLLVHGEYHRYRQLVEQGLLTCGKKYFGQSCVAIAAAGGHAALANYLHLQGGQYESLGKRALIHWMIVADDVGFLRKWLNTHQLADGTLQEGPESGKTLGYLATEHRSIRCLALLKKYFSPEMVLHAWHDKHLLDAAIRSGDTKTLECLLLLIRDVNQKINAEGYNALTLSAELGFINLVQQLPKWGANLLDVDASGRTAMHLAILHNDLELLKAIATMVAPNLWPQDLWTTANVNPNKELVSWLVDKLEQGQKTIDPMKALIALHDAIRLGDGNRVQSLIKVVLDINQVVNGKTALAVATERQQYEIIENLLAHGAKADLPSSEACALFAAAKMNNIYLMERFHASQAYMCPVQVELLNQTIAPIAERNIYIQGALLGDFSQYHADKEKLTRIIKGGGNLKSYQEMIDNNFPINCTSLKLYREEQFFMPLALVTLHQLRKYLFLSIEKLRIDSLDINGDSIADTLMGLEDEILRDVISVLKENFREQFILMLKRQISSNKGFVTRIVFQRKEVLLDLLEEENLLIDYSGTDGLTALHVAVSTGNVSRITRLLDKQFPIDAPDQKGATPLMFAAALGNDVVAKLLLTRGADPNKIDRQGRNAFHHALHEKKLVTSILMMSRTRDLTARDREEKTFLMYAVSAELRPIVRLLMSMGADPSIRDEKNYSALHYAAIKGGAEAIRIMISAHVDIEMPLQLAAKNGQVEACCELLKAGADPTAKGVDGLSAIDCAFIAKRPELIALFQSTIGFYSEKSDLFRIKACCIPDNVENLKLLCTLGVDVNASDQYGRNGLHFAALHNATRCTQILLSLNCSHNVSDHLEQLTPLLIASKFGYVGVIQTLISYGALTDVFDAEGNTPLLNAIIGSHVGAVMALLRLSVNANQASKYGISPSVISFTQPDLKIMQIVSLISGALPSTKELKALPEYIAGKIQPQMQYLEKMRQVWRVACNGGDTVLHLAIRMHSVEAIHLLLHFEPRLIDTRNKAGETPRAIAESIACDYPEVLAALQKNKVQRDNLEGDFELENWLVNDVDEIEEPETQPMLFAYPMSRLSDAVAIREVDGTLKISIN